MLLRMRIVQDVHASRPGDTFCRDSFERAKVIGKRNTFVDGIFAIIFQRDREFIDIVVKLAMYLVLNMGSALFIMFWVFVFGLPRLIWSFGATWVRTLCS